MVGGTEPAKGVVGKPEPRLVLVVVFGGTDDEIAAGSVVMMEGMVMIDRVCVEKQDVVVQIENAHAVT